MTSRQSPKSPQASGEPAVPQTFPQRLHWMHRPWGSCCWGGSPADPPACLAAAPPPELASCLLSVPPCPRAPSLSLPLSTPELWIPPLPPTPWRRARESWALGLKIRTGFLLSHGFPKDRSPHSTLGASPHRPPPRNTLRGKTDNDYVFFHASSVSPA